MDDADRGSTRFQLGVLRAGLVFLAIIVALTFFSKTILNLTLPRVAVEEPRSGPLVRQIHAEGLISATQVTELYPDSRARVYRVSAAKGQVVRAGQVLVVLGCDDLQEELLAALSEAGQAQALLAEALERIATRRVTTMDSAVSLAGESVRTLSTRLEALKNLQGQGLESQEAVNRAALDLMQAELVSKEREDARAAQHQSILARLKSALVVSPCDGVVLEVTAREGGFADPLQPALTILPRTAGLEVQVGLAPRQLRWIETGETVFISGRSGDPRSSDARITQIADNGQVTVSLPRGSPFRAGDAVECSVQKLTQSYPLLVPNAAVGLDSQGSFIWVLQQRGGPLGDEYYVVQAHVTVVDSDDSMTAISSGLQPDEKVVGRSSKPLAGAGSRVTLE